MGDIRVHENNKVYNISYHVVWITKYRKRLLKNSIRNELIKYLFYQANKLNISIETFEIMDDHIHLFIKLKPTISISVIIKQLKGYTSYMLRKQFPILKKYKSLWTHSYFVETIGIINEQSVKRYIEMQQIKK